MKKIYLIFLGVLLCTDGFSANVRSSNTNIRQDAANIVARKTTNRTKTNTITRSAVSRTPVTQQNIVSSRSVVKTVSPRYSETQKNISSRTTTTNRRISRATTNTSVATNTFGNSYTTCRDAYFTCMDQFCATQNDTYRRCVCSSRLEKIQKQESLLSQTSASLQDFKDFNIDAISKTSAEVIAMQNATEGEQGIKEDKSTSMQNLNAIQEVLNNTRQKNIVFDSLPNISNEIQSIWTTSDLIQGSNISTLNGENLYNAVNAQCYNLLADQCTTSDLKLIASAYGIYIENDCNAVASQIESQTKQTNTAIRYTRREMQNARMDNYIAHNSLSFNDCIANIKQDITADMACGQNYIHCLDFTGKYINADTGEPIYSPDFYQFENNISLSGDILKNNKNATYINLLNKKKMIAQQSLDSCHDIADDVWEEFLRQALVEISQAQQQRIDTVKQNCIQVMNQCVSDTIDSLKSFTESYEQISSKQTLELTYKICKQEIDTCNNLYGGTQSLLSTITNIQQNIVAPECPAILDKFVKNLCAVSTNDPVHTYPYNCRVYTNDTLDFDSSDTNTNSLYTKLFNYAMHNCILTESNNPSNINETNKMTISMYVIQAMDSVRISLIHELNKECERLDGTWVNIAWTDGDNDAQHDVTHDELLKSFYTTTNADKSWGYCKQK